jgi:hypothetical protein
VRVRPLLIFIRAVLINNFEFRQWLPATKVDSDARPQQRHGVKKDISFSSGEFEILATHNSSKRGDSQGDQMLEWTLMNLGSRTFAA